MVRRALFVLILLILLSSGIGQSARSTPNEPEGTEALVAEIKKGFANYQWIRFSSMICRFRKRCWACRAAPQCDLKRNWAIRVSQEACPR